MTRWGRPARCSVANCRHVQPWPVVMYMCGTTGKYIHIPIYDICIRLERARVALLNACALGPLTLRPKPLGPGAPARPRRGGTFLATPSHVETVAAAPARKQRRRAHTFTRCRRCATHARRRVALPGTAPTQAPPHLCRASVEELL